jgi:hypothetical protein
MVAMALTMFIMVILTQAFVISMETFSGLKGIGDMQDNLRAGANQFRYDLAQNHFEGQRRTSDPGSASLAALPAREGFFAIFQAAPSVAEGIDADGMPSGRATNHVLQFASRLKGNQQQSFYSAYVTDPNFFNLQTFYNLPPPGDADAVLRNPPVGPFYRSQWAEIAYFLFQTGTTEEPLNPAGTTGTPLYGLYRAQFVVVTDNTAANANYQNLANPGAAFNNFQSMACNLNVPNLVFYTPADLAKSPVASPGFRTFNPSNPTFRSASLVVPNVLSFQVQGIAAGAAAPTDGNYDSANAPPVLQGVSITIRVWDNKTRQTRQLTIVQDL